MDCLWGYKTLIEKLISETIMARVLRWRFENFIIQRLEKM